MEGLPVARVGDAGSHGGSIVTGDLTIIVNDRPVARVGDIYMCPRHGPNPIITGAPSIFGSHLLISHVGCKTACGATIVEGSPDTFIEPACDSGSSQYPGPIAWYHSEQFQILDETTGEPLADVNYTITTQDGTRYSGISGIDGKTYRIYTEPAEEITLTIERTDEV